MFKYAKVGHSKFVEMHGDASEFYLSALVFYARHRVNDVSNCLCSYADMCKR